MKEINKLKEVARSTPDVPPTMVAKHFAQAKVNDQNADKQRFCDAVRFKQKQFENLDKYKYEET